MRINKKNILIGFLGLILVALGNVAGAIIGMNYEHGLFIKDLNMIAPIRENDPSYKFIDPLLAYIIPSADELGELGSLKNNIADFINKEKKNNNLSDASVFFYDLNRGRWIGVNENDKYDPASMLKVVIMTAYFKKAENNPDILKKNLVYTSAIDNIGKGTNFDVPSKLEVGESYTIEDLINKMIIESDNGAKNLLSLNIDQGSLDYILATLNIQGSMNSASGFTISPREYSLFFRILYSGTFLYKKMSEKALDILSKTTFNNGLVAGLPKSTVVSHKFGEHIVAENNQPKAIELHDCGIVYYPSNPYFLCIMTKGLDTNNLKNTIKSISGMVYQKYASQQ